MAPSPTSTSRRTAAQRIASSGGGSKRRRRRCTDTCSPAINNSTLSTEQVIGDDDLLKQILIHLPAKPLLRFKSISKRWCSLISDPQFHLQWIPPKSASSLLLRRHSYSKFNFITLIPKNGIEKKNSKALKSLNFVNDPSGIKISQSCNGLLLCSSSSMFFEYTFFYLLNPTTKQFTTIPRPRRYDKHVILYMNLAFDPSVSIHYKVLAISSDCRGPVCRIDVYSSETRVWMGSGEPFADTHTVVFDNGVFLNGRIHWPSRNSETSIYYDLNREKLLSMPMPRCCHIDEILHFGESGGHLHYIRVYGQWSPQFDVYEMESDYSKWFVKYVVDLDLGVSAFPEMFRMYPDRFTPDYAVDVLCLVGGEVEGDSCLILYIPGKVISYKFKDRSFRKVCNLELHPLDYDNIRRRPWFTIHPSWETPFHV